MEKKISRIGLAISIGGDSAFLRMIKKCSFSEKIYYLGINTGTLGFATVLVLLRKYTLIILMNLLKD